MASVANIAWLVGGADQGRGFAHEAAAGVVTWLPHVGVRRIEAHIHPEHVASQHVAARIGLTRGSGVDADGEEIWATETHSS